MLFRSLVCVIFFSLCGLVTVLSLPHIHDSVCLLQYNRALTSMAFPVLNNVGDYFDIRVTTEGKAKGMRKDEQASVVVHAKNNRMAGRWGAGGDRGDR